MPLHTWLLLAHASTVPVSSDSRAPDTGYIVHEWGTFTAVAGADGDGLYAAHAKRLRVSSSPANSAVIDTSTETAA